MIDCPHCNKSLGGEAAEGGFKIRLATTIVGEDGSVHGPCPFCKADIVIASGAELRKSLIRKRRGPRLVLVLDRPPR